MDLKISDLAQLLNVSQTTIRRWLNDGKLPAYKLNRHYRFSKIEIENWDHGAEAVTVSHTARSQRHTSPLFPTSKQKHLLLVTSTLLCCAPSIEEDIYQMQGHTKDEVIQLSMREIAYTLRVDPDVITELLLDRENLMSTALNNGVAVPHSRECLQHIPFDLIAITLLDTPIDYGALDGKPVDLLFFLFASSDKAHLYLLSKIAHLCSNEEVLSFSSHKGLRNPHASTSSATGKARSTTNFNR